MYKFIREKVVKLDDNNESVEKITEIISNDILAVKRAMEDNFIIDKIIWSKAARYAKGDSDFRRDIDTYTFWIGNVIITGRIESNEINQLIEKIYGITVPVDTEED